MSKETKCVTGSEGTCDWEWRSVLIVVVECMAYSGGVYNWEWSVWLGVRECVNGGGSVCQRVGECVNDSGGVGSLL